ncbi:MAG: MFS transporter, partial [Cyanobacteriota bacterium]|nr:MFS transporter [Cyanobacteriota bacterium]
MVRSSGQQSKSILGWLLYDVASSSYALLIPSVAYAVYYRQVVCGGTQDCDARWAAVTSLSLLLAGLLAPLLGAIADLGHLRYRIFVLTTGLCCAATATLYSVQPGALVWGSLVFIMAQVAYACSASLYDSYLPLLAPNHRLGQLSGLGWGLGYLGGLMSFVLTYGWLQGGLGEANLPAYRFTFVAVAGFYLLVALPAFAWLPRQGNRSNAQDLARLIPVAYKQVVSTLAGWPQRRAIFRFLIGYYLISDGLVTITSFTAIYLQTQFGLEVAQILRLTLLFNAMAIPTTLTVGCLSQRWSALGLLKIILAFWIGLVLLMVFGRHPSIPLLIAMGLGLVVGSTQALCRGLFAQIVPPQQSSELFGFHALVGKISATLGPLVFGVTSAVTGNQLWLCCKPLHLRSFPTAPSGRSAQVG